MKRFALVLLLACSLAGCEREQSEPNQPNESIRPQVPALAPARTVVAPAQPQVRSWTWTEAPQLTLELPQHLAELAFGAVTVSGRAVADRGILELALDEGAPQPLAVAADGSFSVAIEPGQGSHTLRLVLRDRYAREAVVSASFTVLPPPDVTAPSLELPDPVIGGVTTVRRVIMHGAASDDRDLASVRFLHGSSSGELVLDEQGAFELQLTPERGENELEVIATDAAGNETRASVHFFYGSLASAGGLHTGVVREGAVYAWGRNNRGQLGLGAAVTTDQYTPQLVPGLTDVHWISFSQNASIAVREDGTVWTWGENASGQLGLGMPPTGDVAAVVDVMPRSVPTQIPGITDAVAAAMGFNHALVLRADGTVLSFGKNANGQLGDGGSTDHSWPMPVAGLTDVVKVLAGSQHAAALKADGSVWVFGRNASGTLGLGAADEEVHPVAVQVAGIASAIDLASGKDHLLALHADGTASAWGQNANGQVGDGNSGTSVIAAAPVTVLELAGATALHGNANYSLARKADGTAWGWGQNFNGQLGTGDTTELHTPTAQVRGLDRLVAVGCGATHVVAIRDDGVIFAWGWNTKGSLGRSDLIENWAFPEPVVVELP